MPVDRHYRPYELRPDTLITFEVHGRDGTRLRIHGMVDLVPESNANIATKIVVKDAVALALNDDTPPAGS